MFSSIFPSPVPNVGPDPEPTSLPPSYRCDPGWEGYGSYCYQVQNIQQSMQDSRTRCRTLGGDLVSIHDKNENDFVLSVIKAGELQKLQKL